ncbi:MAG: cysteine synthase A [Hyphomicrobiaceae bacterium]|nr:cysteine synthase A [Hyphomicrobiaceae bacterium]MCC0008425.1 cysteine synthase A [Hyphomicrobiaceae bacterium]
MNDMPEIKTLAATRSWGRGRVYDNITETIGQTPLVKLGKVAEAANAKAQVLLKLEFFNPLSSVKDRIGVSMIDTLETMGRIKPGETTLIEPTSGNTGIALAFVAAARGYRLILVMPESMSLERRKILTHLGAELVLTPAPEGMSGALKKADELAASMPGAVIPAQFDNPANPLVHEKTTAEEIWADTGGKVDAIVVGVGTGGTLTGCGRVLKARNPDIKVIAVEPTASPMLSKGEKGPHKIQGIGAGFVPSILDGSLIDEIVTVPNEMAFEVSRLLARMEGIPGGISTGANVAAALTVAARDDMAGKTIVTFAPSAADRYMSTDLFATPAAT